MRTTRAHRRMTALTGVALGVGLVLGLAGCDQAGDDEATPVAEPTEDDKTPKGEDTTEPTDPAEPTDDTSSAAAACLEGTWEADIDSQVEAMRDMLADTGNVLDVTVTGTSTTEYADGRVTTTYDDQIVTTTMDLGGQQLVSTTRYDGTTFASYTATDETVTLSDVDASGLVLEITNAVDGTEMDMGDYTSTLLTQMEAGGAFTYTCSGDTAVLVPSARTVRAGAPRARAGRPGPRRRRAAAPR